MAQPSGRGRPRNIPSNEQLAELQRLYEEVPTQTRVHHEWDSPAGRAFLLWTQHLVDDSHVPLRWVAIALKLDDRILQQAMTRPIRGDSV